MKKKMIMISGYDLEQFNAHCNKCLDDGYLLAFSGATPLSKEEATSPNRPFEYHLWAVFVLDRDVLAANR